MLYYNIRYQVNISKLSFAEVHSIMTKTHNQLLTLDNAGVYLSEKWLVRGVNLTLNRGEIVTLIGPNGSGKSTTAKMALGIVNASEGTVQRQPKIRISYVPQKLIIDWTMPLTVRRFMSLTHPATRDKMQKALSLTETEHLINSEIRNLSGGEFQRVLIARAIVNQPELLVLDEPVQGVDFNGEIALYSLIEKIRGDLDCGIILISHDLHMVMSSTDSVLCLNGHVCCSGTPEIVASAPEFRKLFGDKAADELAFYRHSHDHEHLPNRTVQTLHNDDSKAHESIPKKELNREESQRHA
jgi:zinc transport system ATP-binding protein